MSNFRKFKLDTTQIKAIAATEDVRAKYAWKDGVRDEHQATDDQGRLLWTVQVTLIDEQNKQSDTAKVTLPSTIEPDVTFMAPVAFDGLWLAPYSNNGQGVGMSYSSNGILSDKPRSSSKAAA